MATFMYLLAFLRGAMVEWVELWALLQARDLKLAVDHIVHQAVNGYPFQTMVVKIQCDPAFVFCPQGVAAYQQPTAPATQGFCLFSYARSAVRLFGYKANEDCGL